MRSICAAQRAEEVDGLDGIPGPDAFGGGANISSRLPYIECRREELLETDRRFGEDDGNGVFVCEASRCCEVGEIVRASVSQVTGKVWMRGRMSMHR